MPTCSLALVPMRCSPAPCENVMLRCASVDQRLTGTDSSMKLRRRSVSSPLVRTAAVFFGGGGLSPPSRRLSRLLNGLSGRVTTEREINLPLILSPKPAGRNHFRAGDRFPALDQRAAARYETLQIVPPASSVMNSEPSGAWASPTGRRTGFAPTPPGLGLNPSANVVKEPVGRLDRKGTNTTRNPACGSGARFHEP